MSDKTPHAGRLETDPVELSKAGFRALEERDVESANSIFMGLLEIDPSNSYALVGLAECAKRNKDLPAAADWYRRCLSQDPKNEVSVRGLVMCYSEMNLHKKVTELWESHANLLEEHDSMALKTADAFRKLHNT